MESSRDKGKKGITKGQRPHPVSDGIALPTRMLVAGPRELDQALNSGRIDSTFARNVFDKLCRNGCNRAALAFLLVAINRGFPVALYPSWIDESIKTRRRRAEREARVLTKAAELIRARYPFLTPKAGGPSTEILAQYDKAMAADGLVSPNRLVKALEREVRLDSQTDRKVQNWGLSPNQDNRRMIARYVVCAYVRRASHKPRDPEVATLLDAVGNHPSDPVALAQWRNKNMKRFEPHFSTAVDMLFEMFHRKSGHKT